MPKIIQIPDDTADDSQAPTGPRPAQVSKAKIIQVPDDSSHLSQTGDQAIPRSAAQRPRGLTGKETYESVLSSLPAIGGMVGDLPGAVAGSFARQALTTNEPSFGEAGTDIALQGLLPAVVGKFINAIPKLANTKNNSALAAGIADRISKFTSPTNTGPIDVAADSARNDPIISYLRNSNPDPDAPPPTMPNNAVGNQLLRRPESPDIPSNQTYKQIFDTALSDVQHVRNFKLATGDDGSIEQLALNKVIGKGYSAGNKSVDPAAILKELTGDNKDVYGEAISPATRDRLTQFLTKAKAMEPDQSGNSMMRYVKHRLVFDVAAYGLGHEVGGPVAGGTALILGNQAVSKLMQSDFLGQLALKSLDTPTQAPISPLLTKTIMNGLRGTIAYMRLPDGKEVQVQINDQGNPVPLATK